MRFPEEFLNGMPWVHFKPFKYVMPAVDSKPNPINKAGADGISSVSLFLPGDYNERIGAAWSEQNVIGGAAENVGGKIETEVAEFMKKAAGPKITATVAAGTGTVSYPTDILIFDHVAPIELSFNFTMVPYNKKEADNIVEICKNFKKGILPKLRPGDIAVLEFPPIWDIYFDGVNGLGVEEDNIYFEMALTNVGVDFGSGATSVLTFHDGNPVQIKLSLTFKSTRKQRRL